jgi:hypothetical protein
MAVSPLVEKLPMIEIEGLGREARRKDQWFLGYYEAFKGIFAGTTERRDSWGI